MKLKGVIKQIKQDLKDGKLKLTRYYPYTSVVSHRILEMNHNFKEDEDEDLKDLFEEISHQLKEKYGFWMIDNKIAVKIETVIDPKDSYWYEEAGSFYVGRYDNMVMIGFAVYTERGYEHRIKDLVEIPKESVRCPECNGYGQIEKWSGLS